MSAMQNPPFNRVMQSESSQTRGRRRNPRPHVYEENRCSVRSGDTEPQRDSPVGSVPSSTFTHRRHPSSSTTDPNQSNDDLHHIHVCKRSDAGPLVTVYMTAVEPSLIQEQSSGLYEKLAESERSGDSVTKVVAEAPVKVEGLEMMLRMIMTGNPQSARIEMPFDRFLDLCIACWHFNSSVAQLQHRAAELYDRAWEFDLENKTPGQFCGWVFISLIFGWDVVFQSASLELISEYRRSDDGMERIQFLPRELECAIAEKRAEMLSKTYNFIHRKWLSLYRPGQKNPLFDTIAQGLLRDLNIHVKESHPQSLDQVASSGKLLRAFESILQEAVAKCQGTQPNSLGEIVKQTTVRAATNDSRHKTTLPKFSRQYNNVRSAPVQKIWSDPEVKKEVKSLLRSWTGRGISKTETASKDDPEPNPMEGLEDVCNTLLLESSEFRTLNFRGLDIQNFLGLKEEHVLH